MTCPVCGCNTKVWDSRKNIDHVLRRRRCLGCGFRFNTIETDEDMFKRLTKESITDSEDDEWYEGWNYD